MASEIQITHPLSMTPDAPSVQKVAEAASIRALRQQAEQLLPQRLAALAGQHGFQYRRRDRQTSEKPLGSCDQSGHIVLNLYLMQLPWDCIDYVLLHELVHTKVFRHGPDFWRVMEQELPTGERESGAESAIIGRFCMVRGSRLWHNSRIWRFRLENQRLPA